MSQGERVELSAEQRGAAERLRGIIKSFRDPLERELAGKVDDIKKSLAMAAVFDDLDRFPVKEIVDFDDTQQEIRPFRAERPLLYISYYPYGISKCETDFREEVYLERDGTLVRYHWVSWDGVKKTLTRLFPITDEEYLVFGTKALDVVSEELSKAIGTVESSTVSSGGAFT